MEADGLDAGVAAHYGSDLREQRALVAGKGYVDLSHRDVVTIKPHQVIIVGILLAAGIVAALLILVRIITGGI